jgi:electron transfer flavoprotein alpha subunit
MANVLVVAEAAEGKLKKTTHSAVTFARTAAQALGGTYSILVIGSGVAGAAEEARALGADKVLVADDASLKDYVAERYAPTVAAVGKGYAVVVGTASATGKDLLPRVAARLGAGYAGDISEVLPEGGSLKYKRPMFAGNAFGIMSVSTPVQVVSVRQSAFAAAEPVGSSSPVEPVAVVAPGAGASRLEFLSFEQVKSERPELAEAKVVVSGGRALKERFNEILDPLADTLGAALGASRAACDAGYAPERSAGGADGQGRGAAALLRCRHLRRDPAPRRHEELQGHRRDQQGRGRPDLPDLGLWPRRGSVPGRARAREADQGRQGRIVGTVRPLLPRAAIVLLSEARRAGRYVLPMSSSRLLRVVFALALLLTTVACVQTPKVRLHSAGFQGANLTGAVLDVVIEIHNPNAFDIQVRDVTAETTFAGRYSLPPIVLHPNQWLPAGRSTQVHVPTTLPWLMIPPILAETILSPKVTYTVRGNANVTATRTFGIEEDNYPIQLTGEMPRQMMVNLGSGQISF